MKEYRDLLSQQSSIDKKTPSNRVDRRLQSAKHTTSANVQRALVREENEKHPKNNERSNSFA